MASSPKTKETHKTLSKLPISPPIQPMSLNAKCCGPNPPPGRPAVFCSQLRSVSTILTSNFTERYQDIKFNSICQPEWFFFFPQLSETFFTCSLWKKRKENKWIKKKRSARYGSLEFWGKLKPSPRMSVKPFCLPGWQPRDKKNQKIKNIRTGETMLYRIILRLMFDVTFPCTCRHAFLCM